MKMTYITKPSFVNKITYYFYHSTLFVGCYYSTLI